MKKGIGNKIILASIIIVFFAVFMLVSTSYDSISAREWYDARQLELKLEKEFKVISNLSMEKNTTEKWIKIKNNDDYFELVDSMVSYEDPPTYKGWKIYLENDLDFTNDNIGPVGYYYDAPFEGEFYGQGFSFINYSYSYNYEYLDMGVFGYVNGGLIDGLILKNINIESEMPGYSTGGIVGNLTNGTISNCWVLGGEIKASSTATNCSMNVGGIVGYVSGACTIYRCVNTATVNNYATYLPISGGIAGKVVNSGTTTISECYNSGSIYNICASGPAYASYAGGIVGFGKSTMTIQNCLNKAAEIKADPKYNLVSETPSTIPLHSGGGTYLPGVWMYLENEVKVWKGENAYAAGICPDAQQGTLKNNISITKNIGEIFTKIQSYSGMLLSPDYYDFSNAGYVGLNYSEINALDADAGYNVSTNSVNNIQLYSTYHNFVRFACAGGKINGTEKKFDERKKLMSVYREDIFYFWDLWTYGKTSDVAGGAYIFGWGYATDNSYDKYLDSGEIKDLSFSLGEKKIVIRAIFGEGELAIGYNDTHSKTLVDFTRPEKPRRSGGTGYCDMIGKNLKNFPQGETSPWSFSYSSDYSDDATAKLKWMHWESFPQQPWKR